MSRSIEPQVSPGRDTNNSNDHETSWNDGGEEVATDSPSFKPQAQSANASLEPNTSSAARSETLPPALGVSTASPISDKTKEGSTVENSPKFKTTFTSPRTAVPRLSIPDGNATTPQHNSSALSAPDATPGRHSTRSTDRKSARELSQSLHRQRELECELIDLQYQCQMYQEYQQTSDATVAQLNAVIDERDEAIGDLETQLFAAYEESGRNHLLALEVEDRIILVEEFGYLKEDILQETIVAMSETMLEQTNTSSRGGTYADYSTAHRSARGTVYLHEDEREEPPRAVALAPNGNSGHGTRASAAKSAKKSADDSDLIASPIPLVAESEEEEAEDSRENAEFDMVDNMEVADAGLPATQTKRAFVAKPRRVEAEFEDVEDEEEAATAPTFVRDVEAVDEAEEEPIGTVLVKEKDNSGKRARDDCQNDAADERRQQKGVAPDTQLPEKKVNRKAVEPLSAALTPRTDNAILRQEVEFLRAQVNRLESKLATAATPEHGSSAVRSPVTPKERYSPSTLSSVVSTPEHRIRVVRDEPPTTSQRGHGEVRRRVRISGEFIPGPADEQHHTTNVTRGVDEITPPTGSSFISRVSYYVMLVWAMFSLALSVRRVFGRRIVALVRPLWSRVANLITQAVTISDNFFFQS